MPNYRRSTVTGGTYFITQITYNRQSWLISTIQALRTAIIHVRQNRPFTIDAFVLLPDIFTVYGHCQKKTRIYQLDYD
ncbi:MAG: hypothetical protein RIG63_16725 [Coleofasciculus chthonoplastes F3-SA18-01]